MGGEELKKPIFALLFFLAGFLVYIPSISTQEAFLPETEDVSEYNEIEPIEDPLREAERSFTLGVENDGDLPAAGSSVWAAIRMVLVLVLTAVAIYGVVHLIKKSSKPAAESDPFLKVLASSHLGSNRYAHIVSVGDKAWLLGSSDGGVNLIGEILDKDIVNAMQLEDSQKSTQAPSGRLPDFIGVLRKLGVSAQKRPPTADDLRKRRERLKGM